VTIEAFLVLKKVHCFRKLRKRPFDLQTCWLEIVLMDQVPYSSK
jgi:hypothetical protein